MRAGDASQTFQVHRFALIQSPRFFKRGLRPEHAHALDAGTSVHHLQDFCWIQPVSQSPPCPVAFYHRHGVHQRAIKVENHSAIRWDANEHSASFYSQSAYTSAAGGSMLGKNDVVTFVPTRDYAKARAFYEGVLGLRFVSQD